MKKNHCKQRLSIHLRISSFVVGLAPIEFAGRSLVKFWRVEKLMTNLMLIGLIATFIPVKGRAFFEQK
jgi:hypothetical protein